MKLNTLAPWKKSYDKSRQHIKSRDITLLTRKSYGFCSSHAWMWELDHKEGWVSKNWCFWAVLLEKTLENILNCKIRPVNPKRNQAWVFIGRTDVQAETPILWPPDMKNWLIGKDPDAVKNWSFKRRKTGWGGKDKLGVEFDKYILCYALLHHSVVSYSLWPHGQ